MRLIFTVFVLFWLSGSSMAAVELIYPYQWLQAQTRPVFKPGHTLPYLTHTGWVGAEGTNVIKELADYWGYAIEIDLDNSVYANLTNSVYGKWVINTVNSNPSKYKLSAYINRTFPAPIPDEFYCMTNGLYIKSDDTLTASPSSSTVQSPACPDAYWITAAEAQASTLVKFDALAPISIIRHGGETGLGQAALHARDEPGKRGWLMDPVVTAAQAASGLSWQAYASVQKVRQLGFILDELNEYFPDRSRQYTYYTTGPEQSRNGPAWEGGFDSELMVTAVDLPSFASYYFPHGGYVQHSNNEDLLTSLLNVTSYYLENHIATNWLSWLQGGYYNAETNRPPIGVYTGFIKCAYTIGTLAGDSGFYENNFWYATNEANPDGMGETDGYLGGFGYTNAGSMNYVLDSRCSHLPTRPPCFVEQYVALGRVHALFSWLEDYLRNGTLLTGPQMHRMSADLPAYEFTNTQHWVSEPGGPGRETSPNSPYNATLFGYPLCRTVARKHNARDEWLITSWAADGVDRPVTVTIPTLGTVDLIAAATGNVYRATVATGPQLVNMLGQIPSELQSSAATLRVNSIRGR